MAGRPRPLAFQDTLTKSLIDKYSKPGAIPEDDTKVTEAQRNQILNDLIYLTDVNYYAFTSGLYEGRAVFDTASDLTMLGLGAAGSLTPAASAKAILAAISAGVAGSRVSINKNFFQDQATTALIAKMDASRKTQLALMQDAMAKLSITNYPLSRGLAQLAEYYNAGTIIGAFEDITATAGAEKAAANQSIKDTINLNAVRTTSYTNDDASQVLQTYWMPGQPADLTVNTNHQAMIQQWLVTNGIPDVPIQTLITGNLFADARKKAVNDLKIQPTK